jgi:hypothetical protein
MKRATRRAGIGAAVFAGTLALSVAPAFANDCFNASRNPAVTPNAVEVEPGVSIQGHWVNFDGEGWGFIAPGSFGTGGNFTNGKSEALVANAAGASGGKVCETPNRDVTAGFDALHGIQSPEACGWE